MITAMLSGTIIKDAEPKVSASNKDYLLLIGLFDFIFLTGGFSLFGVLVDE